MRIQGLAVTVCVHAALALHVAATGSARRLSTAKPTTLAISAATEHSCAILVSGQLHCFGTDLSGRLGLNKPGTFGASTTPGQTTADAIVQLPAGRKAVDISTGFGHSCAVLDNGQALCFGDGTSGALGTDASDYLGNSTDPGFTAADGIVQLPAGRKALSISVGDFHTCALLDNGDALCWGYGVLGRLGSDAQTNIGETTTPGAQTADGIVKLPAGTKAVSIDAGGDHSCAVLDDGRALCFGNGANGRLGSDGTTSLGAVTAAGFTTADAVVKLPADRSAVAISAGFAHTCAVLDNGQALCFGLGFDGQLGTNDDQDCGSGTSIGVRTQDGIVQLPSGSSAVAVTTGDSHSCVVLATGTALCFGYGSFGQLGTNSRFDLGYTTAAGSTAADGVVQVPSGRTVVAMSAGSAHTCAVLDNGDALCFGDGQVGQLGTNAVDIVGDSTLAGFTAADGAVQLPPSDFTLAVFAARASTCSISASATVACWGSNAQGQIGSGNANTIGDDETAAFAPALALPAGAGAAALFSGPQHACALLDDGQLSCWGNSAEGRTGYGDAAITPGLSNTPAAQGALPARPGQTPLALALGEGHTCALYEASGDCRGRSVVCWGRNDAGQLGLGDSDATAHVHTPATAAEAQLHAGEVVVSLDAGKDHTCAVYESGGLACWGAGGNGRLGSGATATIGLAQAPGSLPMVALPAGRSAVQVSCGDQHTCVVLDNGELICFGAGGSGRLGYGDGSDRGDAPGTVPSQLTAVALPTGRTATHVSAGAEHTCAVLDDATALCWGEGDDGRLGYGNTNDVGDDETPAGAGIVAMPHGQPVASVSAGSAHTCATLRVGSVVCWGTSPNGELGRGNTDKTGAAAWLTPAAANSVTLPALLGGEDTARLEQQTVPARCSATPSVSSTPTTSQTPTASSSPSGTPTTSRTPTASSSPSGTPTTSQTPTASSSPSGTPTSSQTPTASSTPSGTPTTSQTPTASSTPSSSVTPSGSATASPEAATVGGAAGVSDDGDGGTSLSAGPIIAIVLLLLAAVVGTALFVRRRRQRKRERRQARPVPPGPVPTPV